MPAALHFRLPVLVPSGKVLTRQSGPPRPTSRFQSGSGRSPDPRRAPARCGTALTSGAVPVSSPTAPLAPRSVPSSAADLRLPSDAARLPLPPCAERISLGPTRREGRWKEERDRRSGTAGADVGRRRLGPASAVSTSAGCCLGSRLSRRKRDEPTSRSVISDTSS